MERKNIYQSDELQPAAWLCHHLFDRAPVPIYLFLSFIKSPMNDQSLKASIPVLRRFWKQGSGVLKIVVGSGLARGRMPWWLYPKMYWLWPIRHKRDSSDKNKLFPISLHHFTFVYLLPSRCLIFDGSSSGSSKLPCRLSLPNQFEKSLVEPKEINGS